MKKEKLWTDEEHSAAIEAYLRMLHFEKENIPYSKANIRRDLLSGPLQNRSKGSIEFRMQNISAVLNNQGKTWIPGYKPAKNVGRIVERKIADIILKIEGKGK
ncbi:MAG: hypothetical protein G3M70_06630 [Candidatus Nitronauta litoralis]|uniref:Uncharacterized protein n=1 Tax=Candidatus Nitronauta litoralis TaxID=2705533 RepID=A0A7T0BV50_9BACT|nr:MAG: hypothetical protein G3M70_06630 [Candidatus Nitronauta litoralis]